MRETVIPPTPIQKEERDACERNALICEMGLSGQPDFVQAFDLWNSAASGGSAYAMAKVAEYYAKGLGVKADKTLASSWEKKAAQAGFVSGDARIKRRRIQRTTGAGKSALVISADAKTVNMSIIELEALGFMIFHAKSTPEARRLLEGGKHISLVLVDLKVGSLSGFNIISTLKSESEEYEKIDFIVISDEATKESVVSAAEVGVVGWILKPIKKEEIIAFTTRRKNRGLVK